MISLKCKQESAPKSISSPSRNQTLTPITPPRHSIGTVLNSPIKSLPPTKLQGTGAWTRNLGIPIVVACINVSYAILFYLY